MSKKDFIALADTIRMSNQEATHNGIPPVFSDLAIRDLAMWCQCQNPRFMRERWLDYIAGKCGKNDGRIAA